MEIDTADSVIRKADLLMSIIPRSLLARAAVLAAGAAAFCASPALAGVALPTSGWQWSDPIPQGYDLNAISYQGQVGYAAGAGGTVLKTSDGGDSWSGLFTGTSLDVASIDMVSPGVIVVATRAQNGSAICALRISKDGGTTFQPVLVGASDQACYSSSAIVAYDFVNADLGYILRAGGAVLKTTDGGATLSNVSTVPNGTDIAFVSDTHGFAVNGAGVMETTDGAATWHPLAMTAASRIEALDATHLIAWGSGAMIRSNDGGVTWKSLLTTDNPAAISATDPQHLAYIVGGRLAISSDGGTTFNQVSVGNGDALAVSFVSDSRLVVVGSAGVTYVSADGGATFTRTSSQPVAGQINTLLPSAGGPVGTAQGAIVRLLGGQWQTRSLINGAPVISADFSSAGEGYALQSDGTLVRTKDGGTSWSSVDSGTPSRPQVVLTPDAKSTLLFGRFGVYRAVDGGRFTPVAKAPSGKGLWSVGHLGRRVAYVNRSALKSTGGIALSTDGGVRWRRLGMPKALRLPISYVSVLPSRGVIAIARGRVWRALDDAGRRWSELSLGMNNPGAVQVAGQSEYFVVDNYDWRSPVVLHSTDAGRVWQPEAVGAANSRLEGLVTNGAGTAYALSTLYRGPRNVVSLFQTTTGGSLGEKSTLSLSDTKSRVKRIGTKIQILGRLVGGTGGETVRVAIRPVGMARWKTQLVTAGQNGGGSFTATFSNIKKGKWQVLAQWTGDSGRAGAGTGVRTITVR